VPFVVTAPLAPLLAAFGGDPEAFLGGLYGACLKHVHNLGNIQHGNNALRALDWKLNIDKNSD
jgi:hypothetical protein